MEIGHGQASALATFRQRVGDNERADRRKTLMRRWES